MHTDPIAIYINEDEDDSVWVQLRFKQTGNHRGYALLGGKTFLEHRPTVYELAITEKYGCHIFDIPEGYTPICYLTKEGDLIREFKECKE